MTRLHNKYLVFFTLGAISHSIAMRLTFWIGLEKTIIIVLILMLIFVALEKRERKNVYKVNL